MGGPPHGFELDPPPEKLPLHPPDEQDLCPLCKRWLNPDMEYWAEEYECAMKWLDNKGAPRHEDGKTLSLVGRIARFDGK